MIAITTIFTYLDSLSDFDELVRPESSQRVKFRRFRRHSEQQFLTVYCVGWASRDTKEMRHLLQTCQKDDLAVQHLSYTLQH